MAVLALTPLMATPLWAQTATLSAVAGPPFDLPRVELPSGHEAYWLDRIDGLPGEIGVTQRYRFVVPDLAEITGVPADQTAALSEAELLALEAADPWHAGADALPLDDEALAALAQPQPGWDGDDYGSEAERDGPEAGGFDPEPFDPEQFDPDFVLELEPLDPLDAVGAERVPPLAGSAMDAEAAVDSLLLQGRLPPAPDLLARGPMHDDLLWLCEEFALPRIAEPGADGADVPRPAQIVISLADRVTEPGEIALGAVQLIEVFALPGDRDACVWNPL